MKPRQWMQVAAVASAMGLAGTAIANDMDTSASSTPIDQSSTMSAPSTDQGSTMTSPGSSSSSANDLTAPAQNDNGAASGGATQGSTMESPKPASSSGASSSGHERLANTNSENFNGWASDYASQHDGRITRQEFLDHMGQRFDQLDTQHQGSLTPYEVEEILIVTPASPEAASSAPNSTGNAANADTSAPTLR